MKRVKRRIFSGSVCEQIVYNVPESADIKTARPKKPRFESADDRMAFNIEVSRRHFVQIVNATFSPSGLYSTLTFAQENEAHTVAECKRERDNFYRRCLRKYPTARIVIVYGQGKHTNRFHLHMISDGIPEDEIGKLWARGSVIEVRHLREHNYYKEQSGQLTDHGRDYTALAVYLFDHWRPEFGGHRWKASRTVREPEREQPTEAVREYSEQRPPVPPRGFTLVEARATQYGFQYFKYVKIPGEIGRRERRLD